MVFLSHIFGLGGHFGRAGSNCIFCEVDSKNLFSKQPSKKRSLKRLYKMAHMLGPGVALPFTCPGCKKQFNTKEDLVNDEAPSCMTDYERQHASTGWHRRPLLDIEPSHAILCCLHLVLSLTKLLFKKRVLWMIHTNAQATRVNDYLASIGVCIPKQGKVGDSLAKDQTGRIRFTGPDCCALMRNFDQLIAVVLIGAPNTVGLAEWASDT